MKKLLVILVFGLVLLSSVGTVRAEAPYVYISFAQEQVDLYLNLAGTTIIPEALTVKVNSNCMHGSVVATIGSLKNAEGIQITNDRIFIKTVYTGGFIPMQKSVAISEPAFGSHNIVVDFMVRANKVLDRAGEYQGSLAFTVMPPA